MYLLTRPLPKLSASASAFAEAGLTVCTIALTDIGFIENTCQLLYQRLKSETPPDIVIITSVFAAKAWLDTLEKTDGIAAELNNTKFIAVGSTSAAMLRQAHPRVITPEPQTSEGVVKLPLLGDAKKHHVFIIKGQGGRTLLQETLVDRDCRVDVFEVYQRVVLKAPVTSCNADLSTIKGVVVTSEEQAAHLLANETYQQLINRPWLTVSPRVASSLGKFGITQVGVCERASDEALIHWIKDNWE